jgi:hypothetical protein
MSSASLDGALTPDGACQDLSNEKTRSCPARGLTLAFCRVWIMSSGFDVSAEIAATVGDRTGVCHNQLITLSG